MSQDDIDDHELENGKVFPGLLGAYFKIHFDKIDNANSDFCNTLEERRISRYLAKKLNLSKGRLASILRSVADEN